MNAIPRAVTGKIIFTDKIPPFKNASIHIVIEDVTIADRPAEKIASIVLTNINHPPEDIRNLPTTIPFSIHLEEKDTVDARNFYGIRVWVNVTGDEKHSADVLYSDKSFRVLTHGFPDYVDINF